MQVAVYDTYYTSESGKLIHFDVLVEDGSTPEKALAFAREWLDSIGEHGKKLRQERCSYCHSENASAEIEKEIGAAGYYILQL